ncbi:MAG: YbjQ family protein [Sulfolobales archaeon]|nr:YbjQ family protein [Sulfolobales archaeon]MCX8209212.1 YbjQ family protein [Sulfolobales archaeon]MDW8010956.1 YbjQ family protein [Sulfolobales archaeon]
MSEEFVVTTLEYVPGYRIKKILGLVSGSTVKARNIGRDILALFRNIAGGEIVEYTELLAGSRDEALRRMVEKAKSMGANAVVGVRLATSSIMSGAAEVVAYGTAVVLEKE